MVFGERTYSVLVVSAGQKFRDAMAAMLPYSEYYPVCYSESVAAARRELLARNYDFVIICAPLPDDYGTQFAIDVCSRADSVALLLLRADAYGQINAKVCPYGVFTLQLPVSTQSLKQGLGWMAAARERLRRLEKKTTSIEDKMEEIRLVNRAKWILIEQLKMTEAEAHRHIEKQAMDRCVSKKEIAFGIINTYT
ncbi:MAG: ANTAR domain-containing protein [Candidatus Faecousia sp.]|nr:ANTAR domain-containing protein [Clostridiales bacterium]MDY6179369.1 ANTAR domain-containing protein [Candidatus Faecousia sp.]